MSVGDADKRPAARLRSLAGHTIQTFPFDPHAVEGVLDLGDHAYLELKQNSRVYSLACAYIALHGKVDSLRYSPMLGDNEVVEEAAACESPTLTTIGLGIFPFSWSDHDMYALHQTIGQPVGANNGIDVFTSLVLFARRGESDTLGAFCHELVTESERTQSGFVNVFEWHPSNRFWQARVICPARSLQSVVLPEDVKGRLLEDVREFVGPEARRWYNQHGIQHKRGYLFFGPPGTGKTSMVQALAGHFEHNICQVHLTHPNLTDESLRAAVNQAPRKSLLVFEDVDAIFSKDREKLLIDSSLTFSGLLNALDGVGKADGQIFVLTTNHRERLNPALIRNGRVDVHVEFLPANDEQVAQMFLRFYPVSTQRLAGEFVQRLRGALGGRAVTTASLQHFFIVHRKSSAAEALGSAHLVVEEMDLRADEQDLLERDLRATRGRG